MDIEYTITFFSEWHCGSGLSAGFGADLTVIRDKDGLPVIPGKTLKGLLRDAAHNLAELDGQQTTAWDQFIAAVFGKGGDETAATFSRTDCFFSDAELKAGIRRHLLANAEQKKFLYRKVASTAIDSQGCALKHSLRVMETVVPLTMVATIARFPDNPEQTTKLDRCMKWLKRLGVHRTRGLGRCRFDRITNGEDSI